MKSYFCEMKYVKYQAKMIFSDVKKGFSIVMDLTDRSIQSSIYVIKSHSVLLYTIVQCIGNGWHIMWGVTECMKHNRLTGIYFCLIIHCSLFILLWMFVFVKLCVCVFVCVCVCLRVSDNVWQILHQGWQGSWLRVVALVSSWTSSIPSVQYKTGRRSVLTYLTSIQFAAHFLSKNVTYHTPVHLILLSHTLGKMLSGVIPMPLQYVFKQ